MKTIKIIDLLNKIANGEEVPGRIIYNGYNYLYHTDCKNYYRSVVGSNWIALTTDFSICTILNDEVEIIEEDKEIDKIEIFEDKDNCKYVYNKLYEKVYFSQQEILLSNKINELIDYLKSKEKGE